MKNLTEAAAILAEFLKAGRRLRRGRGLRTGTGTV